MENIKLYSFEEALEKLKRKEISMLIRMKWINSDYKRIIGLFNTEYINISSCGVQGKPNCLYRYVKLSNGSMEGSPAKLISEELFSEDWIDTNQWEIVANRKDFDDFYAHF